MTPRGFLALLLAVVLGAGVAVWLTGGVRTRKVRRAPRTSGDDAPVERAPTPLPPPESAFSTTFDAARVWLDAEDREAARAAWDAELARLRETIGVEDSSGRALLVDIGTWPDAQAALASAVVLRHVPGEGFELHLIATSQGGAPATARRGALIGLRGRGERAAAAVAGVASRGREPAIRIQATGELARHLADPAAASARTLLLDVLAERLSDDSEDVRLAALRAVRATATPHGGSIDDRVAEMAHDDPKQRVRELASELLSER